MGNNENPNVFDVYYNFLKKYPDIISLCKAVDGDIEQILYPLGLAWRVSAFKNIAIDIQQKYYGKVPDTREELLTLQGVGDYVAGAVLSFIWQKSMYQRNIRDNQI